MSTIAVIGSFLQAWLVDCCLSEAFSFMRFPFYLDDNGDDVRVGDDDLYFGCCFTLIIRLKHFALLLIFPSYLHSPFFNTCFVN